MMGIDIGSRKAGTTAVAVWNGSVSMYQSEKGKDADALLEQIIQEYRPSLVAIDAPLSLPGVYRNMEGFSNYHFRMCDLECAAMSPMFLGGLSARAIQMLEQWKTQGIQCIESYPKMQAMRLGFVELGYKKEDNALQKIHELLSRDVYQLPIPKPANWHQMDALLALVGAMRFAENKHTSYGVAQEGLIII